MTIINGASNASVEDILASIRTSIAEEAGPARFVAGEIQMPAPSGGYRREAQVAEEAPEFELPAIFKPGHHTPADKPKLLGRLSDALKSAPHSEQGRVRTVIPFDPSVANRVLEAGPVSAPLHAAPAQASASTSTSYQRAPAAQHAGPQTEVKREMPTFFDTRINKLGELTRQSFAPKVIEPPQAAPQAESQAYRRPPTLPDHPLAHHASDTVDDAAAQLLRPMLRQWLHENMPKIVEKALLSEVQGTPPNKTLR